MLSKLEELAQLSIIMLLEKQQMNGLPSHIVRRVATFLSGYNITSFIRKLIFPLWSYQRDEPRGTLYGHN